MNILSNILTVKFNPKFCYVFCLSVSIKFPMNSMRRAIIIIGDS